MLPLLEWVHDTLANPVAPEARAVDHAPDPAVVALVAKLLAEDRLTSGDWAAVAARLWMRCGPSPLVEADGAFWRALFGRAGWAVNGYRSAAKVAYVTLWRGASAEWQRGWAWADQRAVAEILASGYGERSPAGRLWKTRAPRAALLASIVHLNTGEVEIVCDPDLLGEVEAVEDVDPDESMWATLGPRPRGPLDDDPPPLPSAGRGVGARLLGRNLWGG